MRIALLAEGAGEIERLDLDLDLVARRSPSFRALRDDLSRALGDLDT